MSEINVVHDPDEEKLNALGVREWSIWTKEASEFPWHYDARETCYFLEGDVEVRPDGGEGGRMGKGDLVSFPQGMSCTWKIQSDVKKHYRFE